MPAHRDGRLDEPIGRNGRRPVRPSAVEWFAVGQPRRDQPRGRRQLEDQPEPRLVDAGHLRQPLDVAHTEAAAAELGNWCGAEGFDYQLDFADDVDDRACRDSVDILCGRLRHHGVGWRQLDRPGALAAQRLADQPRQDHRLRVDLSQQAGRQAAAAPDDPAACRGPRRASGPSASPPSAAAADRAARRRGRRAGRRSRRLRTRDLPTRPGPDTRAGPLRLLRPPGPRSRPTPAPARAGRRSLRRSTPHRHGHRAARSAWSARPASSRHAVSAGHRAPPAAGSPARRWRP